MSDGGADRFDELVAAVQSGTPQADPTRASLGAAVVAVTGQPVIATPILGCDIVPAALEAALREAGGNAVVAPLAAPQPSLAAQLATTRRLIAEIEVELERLRTEAEELEHQLAAQGSGAEQRDPAAERDLVIEKETADHGFSAIFRRDDPARPSRLYRGYVEIIVPSPASPYAIRDLERALTALPDASIRLIWGTSLHGTTIGVDLRQPVALAAWLKTHPFVESVRELADRGGVGRVRARLREP
ncbi:MAG: hypothetical protein RMM58_10065 [Chloroflexota bacterium]|nr:hypothetical protein [Dehalococcoidia bacterium]MDW8254211.1 hypothetical protein [Chloroflexota bacterium]